MKLLLQNVEGEESTKDECKDYLKKEDSEKDSENYRTEAGTDYENDQEVRQG